MSDTPKPKKGANKTKRVGSRKRQIERYYSYNYAVNKLRRILHSNGVDAARSWAEKHGAMIEFRKLVV